MKVVRGQTFYSLDTGRKLETNKMFRGLDIFLKSYSTVLNCRENFFKNIIKWYYILLSDIRVQKSEKLQNDPSPYTPYC